jgi:hypothetical protein
VVDDATPVGGGQGHVTSSGQGGAGDKAGVDEAGDTTVAMEDAARHGARDSREPEV